MVATAHSLRHGGSRAEIVFLVHITAGHDSLQEKQEGGLTLAGMWVRYLERTWCIVNFFMATLNKFRILQSTECDRVLFLCNMDCMFEELYTEEGLFKDDVTREGSVASMGPSMFLLGQSGSGCTTLTV